MDNTKIEWADATWNPVIGCEQKSPGCAHCYAKVLAETRMGLNFGVPTYKPHKDLDPLVWQRPRVIFVNSLSDLFWDKIDQAKLDRWFAVMALADWHTFMVLTKDHERMLAYLTDPKTRPRIGQHVQQLVNMAKPPLSLRLTPYDDPKPGVRKSRVPNVEDPAEWPLKNLQLGVSAENQHWLDIRVPYLKKAPAVHRFLSIEPMLSDMRVYPHLLPSGQPGVCVDVDGHWWHHPGQCPACLPGIDRVIGGGESGHKARPMFKPWVQQLMADCQRAGVRFTFKQWGVWAPVTLYQMSDHPGFEYVQDDNYTVHHVRSRDVITGFDATRRMARIGKTKAGRKLDGKIHD